jgi:hypothetical protein
MASEYGITIKQFGEMTAREVFICMNNINTRIKNNFMFQAKIHGMEIKDTDKPKQIITKEQDELMTKRFAKMNAERFKK